MRNINELIGIIKGINFDGIINDREVEWLQTWIDRNRNLAYESKQAKLIALVESALENHVIKEKEKDELLSIAESFLNDSGDDLGHIYELNGIIEGIICDGEINVEELCKLDDWMRKYGDIVQLFNNGDKLRAIIKDIVKNGKVSEDEQKLILGLLSEKISNFQLEVKIRSLCNLVRERKNIGVDIIDILDNEAAMDEIHARAEEQLMCGLASYSGFCPNCEIVVVSLVLIAMLEYDGNYYNSVRSTYQDVYGRYSEQRVEGYIRSILARYRRKEDLSSRIINVALENAIVPKTYLSAFFDFIFDIYKLNMNYDLSSDLYGDFLFVFEGLRNVLRSEGDEISIKVTQKTYKLIVSTKQLLFTEEGTDAVIKLGIIVVKLIDKRYWNKDIKIFNPYLKAGFEGWEKQLTEFSKGKKERGEVSPDLRSRWEPKFDFAGYSVFIVPPIHRVKAQYDYTKLMAVVENDGKVIYQNNACYVKEIIGGYQISIPRIAVSDPLGHLTYKFLCGDEIIYSSKNKLYRECLVYNNEGQEISNNTDYAGPAFFCCREENESLKTVAKKEHFIVGYKLIRKGDVVGIGHEVFCFSTMVKPGVFGDLNKNCFVREIDSERTIPVYKKINVVSFEAENTSQKYEIVVNDKPRKLSEMSFKSTSRGTVTKYVVDLDFDHAGIYRIEINQLVAGKKERILREVVAYDSALRFSAKSNNNKYSIIVESDLIGHRVETEISANEYSLDMIRFLYDGK